MQRIRSRQPMNRFDAKTFLFSVACVLIFVTSAVADPPARGGRFQREREREKAEEEAKEKGKTPDEPSGGGPALRKAEAALTSWLARLDAYLPRSAAGFGPQDMAEFDRARMQGIEAGRRRPPKFDPPPTPEELGQIVNLLLDSKDRVDRVLNRTLELRTGLAGLDKTAQHDSIRHFLTTTSGLIDLSGRLRYLLFDALNYAAEEGSELPAARDQFLDLLTAHRSSIGALVAVGALLFDPVSTDPAERIEPTPASVKRKVLNLVAVSKVRWICSRK